MLDVTTNTIATFSVRTNNYFLCFEEMFTLYVCYVLLLELIWHLLARPSLAFPNFEFSKIVGEWLQTNIIR
jgi:hypothetical protein